MLYKIVRMYFDKPSRTIKTGLYLDEAQAWCKRDDTSSHSTGAGAWFDGYEAMPEPKRRRSTKEYGRIGV